MKISKALFTIGVSSLLVFQSIVSSFAATDEIHLINDLGNSGYEMTLEEQAERDWNEDLVSAAKGTWYNMHDKDEEEIRKAGTPSDLATSSDLSASGNVFEDFDESKAQKEVEKLLKKADKAVASQSSSYLTGILKEAAIPKDAAPRESSLKSEILSLYGMNDDEYTIFHNDEGETPEKGDIIFFSRTEGKKATADSLSEVTTESEEQGIKRRASRAALGGIVFDVTKDGIAFIYSPEKDSVSIGYMPVERKELIGFASVQELHDKYCGILEEEMEEEEALLVEEETLPEEESALSEPFSYEETIWGYRISLNAEAGVFPAGTTVSIKPVTTIDGHNIEELLQKQDENENITKVMSFDITFTCDGEEIQPEDGSVSISIKLASDMLKEKRKSDTAEISVYHVQNADEIEKVPSDVTSRNEVVYDAESFSVYSVALSMATTANIIYWGVNEAGELRISSRALPSTYVGDSFDGSVEDERLYAGPWYGYADSIKTIVVGSSTDKVKPVSTRLWFSELPYVDSIDLRGLDLSNTKTMEGMFSKTPFKSLDLRGLKTSNVSNMNSLFADSKKLEEVNCSTFDTSNVTDMGSMFSGCIALKTIDVTSFDTSKAINMGGMFAGCSGLKSVDVSGFNTSSATSLGAMFASCYELTEIDVSGFDTKNVTEMGWMFEGCSLLGDLNVTSFNTAKVTDMDYMFSYCRNLEELDISSFNTSNVKSMRNMFSNCHKLKNLDLSGFDTSKVLNTRCMFDTCSNLTTIAVGNGWTTKYVTDSFYMFSECRSLVGGAGTTYNDSYKDASYACIDGGTSNPGYLTGKFITGIKLDKTSVTLETGKSSRLVATVLPSNDTIKAVTWKSSNTSVATVDIGGTVKGIAPGKATITVVSPDGKKTASCAVTVNAAKVFVTGVKLNKTSLVLDCERVEKLSATVSPSNATNKAVTWKSNNSAVVTVSSDGTIKAIRVGTAVITVATVDGAKTATCKVTVRAKNGWYTEGGKEYWYENGVKQGTVGRGKEIYDPGTNAWYWLDQVQGGAKAVNKEVYQESNGGKWVRYDAQGHMIKGWYSNSKGTYYYDLITGAMAKGDKTISNIPCYFNATTGVGHDGWRTYSGKNYWYEHGERQGTKYDKNGVKGDGTVRGREIFDPGTNAWYWLDAVYDGAKAENKEVWMPYIFQNENPKTAGKWVRYNGNGGMVKGWYTIGNKKYYYDPTTGAMAKGTVRIENADYTFDSITGELHQAKWIKLRNHVYQCSHCKKELSTSYEISEWKECPWCRYPMTE